MADMIFEDYIPNLVDSMLLNLKVSDSNFLLLKHYNTFDLSREDVDLLAATRTQVTFLYHSFEAGDMLGAYEPFLDWVKQLYDEFSEESIETFLEKNHVYPLHRPIFKSYFESGLCSRTEEVLVNEIEQERSYFMEALARMLRMFSEIKPMVFVLNKMQAAGSSTIDLLDLLVSGGYTRNMAILGTYNEMSPEIAYTKDVWNGLLAKFDAHDCIVDWTMNSVPLSLETGAVFKFDGSRLPEYYTKLNNMYTMLALDQAEYYLDIFYHKTEVEKVYIAPEYKVMIFELFAKVAMCQDKMSDALLYCNGMGSIVEEEESVEWKYRYYYLAAQIHMYSHQQEMSNQCVEKCEELCRLTKDSFMQFRTELLKHMIFFQGWRNIWVLVEDAAVKDDLIARALQYGYLNHVAHIYVYSFDNDPKKYSDVNKIEERIPNFNKGIEIAAELGNVQLLIESYKKSVMISSINGYYDVANYFYGRSYEVVTQGKNLTEEAGIYNGMGYNCCTMEQYTKASEYFNKALLIFAKLEDVESINETIYNMGVNAVLAGEFSLADFYLSTCVKIVRIMKMKSNSVRVCNISKIYGLRAYCCYKMGVLYNCKINTQYMKQFLGHIIELSDRDAYESHLWDDDLFLYHFVEGLLAEHENRLEEAYVKMQKARKYVNRSPGSAFLNRTPYSIGCARICRKLGKEEEAQEVLKECMAFCDGKGYLYKKNMVKAELEKKAYVGMKWNLSIKGISMDELIDMVIRKGLEKNYEEQKSEINFLSIWQKFINNTESSIDRMIKNAITTLKNNYNMDELIFIRIEGGKPIIRYNDSQYNMDADVVDYLVSYFSRNRSEFATTRLDKEYAEHGEMINRVFGLNAINTLICAPLFVNEQLSGLFISDVLIGTDWNYKAKRYEFDDNDLSIFMMLYRQLLDAIERMEARNRIQSINNELQYVNGRLKEMAIKDKLTGLYNREGFLEELYMELNTRRREGRQMELTFLYADLDNFKHYNDTFGHEVGDLILQLFSRLIESICSAGGFAVRYGGDEFILVLFTNDREQAEQAAKSIYSTLEEQKGFKRQISEKLGRQVEITPKKRVSCSIGISRTTFADDDVIKDKLEETLRQADEMMYHVKKTTKHRYVFYEDEQQAEATETTE